MTSYRYAYQGKEVHAKALGRSLPISTKQAVEICTFIRKKSVQRVKVLLEKVTKKEIAVPYKRYVQEMPHRKGKGITTGRYPIKATAEILKIVKTAEANAKYIGMGTDSLIVDHAAAHRASKPHKYGRHRGREAKRTHVEIAVIEKKQEKKEAEKKQVKK